MEFIREYFELIVIAQLTIIMIFGYLFSLIVFREFNKANAYGYTATAILDDMHTAKLNEIDRGIDNLFTQIEGFEANVSADLTVLRNEVD